MSRLLPANLTRLFGIRDFTLLWAGGTISMVGDGVYFVAIAWEVYRISNVPTALGVVSAAFGLPQVLLLLVGGVLSDRIDRRLVMLWGNAVSALTVGGIGLLVLVGRAGLPDLIPLVAAYGTSQAFFMPASRAIVPGLVEAALLPQAMAVEQFVSPITQGLVGPALGGLLIALHGSGVAFLVDALSFAIATITLAAMAPAPAPPPTEGSAGESPSVLREAGHALRFVRSVPWIWAGLAAAGIANVALTGPLQVLVPFLIKYRLHGGPQDLGWYGALGGAGAISAALFVAWRGIPRRQVTWIFASWAVSTLAMIPLGLARSVWELLPCAFFIIGGVSFGNLIWFARMGVQVPGQLLGRVASLDMTVSFALNPLSSATTGPLAQLAGARPVLLVSGAVATLITLAFLLVPGVHRDLPPLPAPSAARAP
ncbi:MAG: MFS transporter [Candidatus Dormibacteria bacterium]